MATGASGGGEGGLALFVAEAIGVRCGLASFRALAALVMALLFMDSWTISSRYIDSPHVSRYFVESTRFFPSFSSFSRSVRSLSTLTLTLSPTTSRSLQRLGKYVVTKHVVSLASWPAALHYLQRFGIAHPNMISSSRLLSV